MAKRQGDHSTLGDILKDFISSGKLEKGLNKVSAEDAWHQVMGDAISKYTMQVMLEGETLHVQLSSSVLREELTYGKEKIIRLLNEALEKELIKKLVLR
ncbi:MAG: DUF721 domain-containing protein [Flavobacteriaceae bacterium]|nr:DUF721 domain-containing protein [Flavobacteriaceae bacterium]